MEHYGHCIMEPGQILDLPPELLYEIICYLSVGDIIQLNRSCKFIYSLCSDENLWRYFCRRDFKANININFSKYFDLYKWLHKYRYYLGLREIGLEAYGGMVVIEYEDGKIVGNKWCPDKTDLTKPLTKKRMFLIRPLDTIDEIMCTVHNNSHKCTILQRLCEKNVSIKNLVLTCGNPDSHEVYRGISGNLDLMDIQYRLMLGLGLREGLHLKPLKDRGSLEVPQSLLKNKDLPPNLIRPGLFKGTYGPHGIELVLLSYKNDYEIHGVKITGDPNVFAGKVTLKISLNFPFHPSNEDQISFDRLTLIEASSQNSISGDQEFYLPPDCYNRHAATHKTCKARYHGLGQVAFTNFTNPSFIPAHIMIFSPDVFGAIFLGLKTFSLFERVKQKDFIFENHYKFK